MGKARDAFGLVLTGMRAKLLSGEIAPGQLLALGDLAAEFSTSVTPVREALTRLTGEGLLVGTRRAGFARPALSVDGLVDLYALHHGEVAWALDALARRGSAPGQAFPKTACDDPLALDGVFVRLVSRAGNEALVIAHRTTTLQLGPARRVERVVLAGVDVELLALAAAAEAGAWRALSRAVVDYHVRRAGAAVSLLEAARLSPGS